jgi:hypothetical protein
VRISAQMVAQLRALDARAARHAALDGLTHDLVEGLIGGRLDHTAMRAAMAQERVQRSGTHAVFVRQPAVHPLPKEQPMARGRLDSHPVAVVVFLNADGPIPHDSANNGELAVQQALRAASKGTGQLVLETRGGLRGVSVVQAVELTRAGRNGLILPATSPSAYKS